MKLDDNIMSQFSDLLELGQQVMQTKRSRSTSRMTYIGDAAVDSQLSHEWGASCLNLLDRVVGKESDFYIRFDQLFPEFHDFSPVQKAFGILKAADSAYRQDRLFDTRRLIEAEVFDDFLEQAQHLCDHGYFEPAAVIAGCVLEDGLRRLCIRNHIPLPSKATIDPLNVALAQKGVYNKLRQKKITALADIRNNAAHGKWDAFTKTDTEGMIKDVRTFMEEYFS